MTALNENQAMPNYSVNDYGRSVEGDALDVPGNFRVHLASCGNPDYLQDPDEALPGADAAGWMKVASLREASNACSVFIGANELGGGNWAGGEVVDATGKMVARVSYNGRVWQQTPAPRARKNPGMGM